MRYFETVEQEQEQEYGGGGKVMKHVIFFSGGLGSWRTFHEVHNKYGLENTYCIFTDTLIEDRDLYRFMLETWGIAYGEDVKDLLQLVKKLPSNFTEGKEEERKKKLTELGELTEERFDGKVMWRNMGLNPFDIYIKTRFLGNSKMSKCSHVIKQDLARDMIESRFTPEDSVLYLGIDYTEAHRAKNPTKHWAPYEVRFPLISHWEEIFGRGEHSDLLEEMGVALPRLYGKGFEHNNCGGFCSRAGQKHFVNLLETNRDHFLYCEAREREWRETIGKDHTILQRQIDYVKHNLPLQTLREEYEANNLENIDMLDVGGCGCFVEYDEEVE